MTSFVNGGPHKSHFSD